MQLRGALARRIRRARLRGDAVECPCCGRTWSAFAPAWNRPGAICPGCGAHERHRGLWLYLRERVGLGREPLRLLHFAPEYALRVPIEALEGVDYVTADLDPTGVDVQLDITAMPFADGEFDAIICSHVLEHVSDDRAAMSELARVLRPGGWLLVLVPLDAHRERTHEDPAVRTPEDREREFLQRDHVRLYAPDVADRLREAGLTVRADRLAEALPEGAIARHGLLADETVFHCTVPASLGT
jgi:SAM-dependent methyltransferase